MKPTLRRERRADIEGELLPPEDDTTRALVPVNQARPVIRIRLPERHEAETGSVEHEVRRPARSLSFEADVKVPFAQAALTAIAVGVCTAFVAWALGWSWRAVAVAFGLALALGWFWRLRLADALLWEVERLTGHDFNGDGHTGQPATRPVLLNAWEARQEAAQVVTDEGAQSERAALVAFLNRCYVVGCSESAHGVKASGPDREAYVRNRDLLLSLGIAAWKNPARPRAGWQLVVSHAKAADLIARHTL